ncbi:spermine spermidine synthase, partial [Cystoisospora suis]
RIFEVNKWRFLRFAVHSFQPGSRSTVSIHRSHPSQSRGNVKNDLPLYTLTIYDRLEPHYKEDGQEKEKTSKKHSTHEENSGKKANVKTAALFIPRGRECSWLYSTPEGNQELAIQANVSRLLLVSLGLGGDEPDEAVSGSRDDSLQFHTTATLKKDFEKIKDDLSPYLADLALPGSGEVPVLIVGEENSVRAEKTRVESPYAGWIIVRDVEREEEDEEDGEDEGDEEEKKEKIEKKGRESSSSCSSMKDTKKNKRKSKKTGKKDGEIHKNKDKKNHSSSSFSSPSISSSRRNVGVYRQMIFSCNPHALQSEVKVGKSS